MLNKKVEGACTCSDGICPPGIQIQYVPTGETADGKTIWEPRCSAGVSRADTGELSLKAIEAGDIRRSLGAPPRKPENYDDQFLKDPKTVKALKKKLDAGLFSLGSE